MSPDDRLLKFLADIRRQPDDMRLRERLAQFLEDRGDPRVEWIRIQCANDQLEMTFLPNWIAQFTQFDLDENDRREAALLESYGGEWFASPPPCVEAIPQRGLFEVQLSEDVTQELQTVANWLRRQQPWIETLSISVDEEHVFLFLAEQGLLDEIAHLHLYVNCELSVGALNCLAHLVQLHSLLLNGGTFTDESLEHVGRLRSLRSLELLSCESFHGQGLFAIAALPELRRLTVRLGGEFTEFGGLAALQRLEHLKIRCSYPRDEPQLCDRICKAVRALGALQTLHIGESTEQGATNVGLRALGGLTRLESLTLELAADADVELLAALPQLQELNLCGAGATDAQLERVARLKSLRRFGLWSDKISGAGLPHLSALEQLESLSIHGLRTLSPQMSRFAGRRVPSRLELIGKDVTDESLQALSPLSQLTALDLRNAGVTSDGLQSLCDLPRLAALFVRLEQLQGFPPDVAGRWTSLRKLCVCGRASLRPLSYFRSLPDLSIVLELLYGDFDETELAFLSDMPQIKLLDISNSASISNAGLRHLAGLTQLQQLSLGESEITEDGLRFLSGMHEMRELRLGDIPLQGDGLKEFQGMTNLLTLRLNHTGVTDAGMPHVARLAHLEDLDLYRSQITDGGLVHLTALRRLKSLNLSYCCITDAGVAHLVQMPRLQHLWINQTEITETGYRELQLALPQCSFRYSRDEN